MVLIDLFCLDTAGVMASPSAITVGTRSNAACTVRFWSAFGPRDDTKQGKTVRDGAVPKPLVYKGNWPKPLPHNNLQDELLIRLSWVQVPPPEPLKTVAAQGISCPPDMEWPTPDNCEGAVRARLHDPAV
jgi:hypothetical protein